MTQFECSSKSGRSFDYEYTPRQELAPGMSSKISVTFKCMSWENLYEFLVVFPSRDETNTKLVLVCVENTPPVLRCKYTGRRLLLLLLLCRTSSLSRTLFAISNYTRQNPLVKLYNITTPTRWRFPDLDNSTQDLSFSDVRVSMNKILSTYNTSYNIHVLYHLHVRCAFARLLLLELESKERKLNVLTIISQERIVQQSLVVKREKVQS